MWVSISFAYVVASGPRSREARRVGASGICIVARLTLLVCLYASPCVSLQVLDLERRGLWTMDATDESPVLLLLFALRPSLCCVQKAIL